MKYNIITKVCYIFELNSEQEMFANEYMICFQLITPHIIKFYKTIYDYFVIYTQNTYLISNFKCKGKYGNEIFFYF